MDDRHNFLMDIWPEIYIEFVDCCANVKYAYNLVKTTDITNSLRVTPQESVLCDPRRIVVEESNTKS